MSDPSDLHREVRQGLADRPKRLPPHLLYDDTGSELFEKITELPEYYLTRSELSILREHSGLVADRVGEGPWSVVELGAGSALKTRYLLDALMRRDDRTRFVPVDVSSAALQMAEERMKEVLPELTVDPLHATYEQSLAHLRRIAGKKLVLFIGSSIGNLDPDQAVAFLGKVALALGPDDALLLGTDLEKEPSVLVAAYSDAQGVTAEFNYNLLDRLNRELGADFDRRRFKHVALWNADLSRMESHLESTEAQEVSLPALDMTVRFERGERIHTECSHKYTEASLTRMLDRAGLVRLEAWEDERGWYALTLCARAAASLPRGAPETARSK